MDEIRLSIIIWCLPYGFGPSSKALTLANELTDWHDVTIVTYGDSIYFVRNSVKYINVTVIDAGSRSNICNTLMDIKSQKDVNLFISIMDYNVFDDINSCFKDIRFVFFDMLWGWRKLCFNSSVIDLILIEKDPVIEQNANKLIDEIHESVSIRGTISVCDTLLVKKQLIRKALSSQNGNRILINLGGVSSPRLKMEDNKAIIALMDWLFNIVCDDKAFEFVISGNNWLNKLSLSLGRQWPVVMPYPHDEFLELLLHCECIFTVPSLGIIHESLSYNKNPILLPPICVSQAMHYSVYISSGFYGLASTKLLGYIDNILDHGINFDAYKATTIMETAILKNIDELTNHFNSCLIRHNNCKQYSILDSILTKTRNQGFVEFMTVIDEFISRNSWK
jgi:hypothetical protein